MGASVSGITPCFRRLSVLAPAFVESDSRPPAPKSDKWESTGTTPMPTPPRHQQPQPTKTAAAPASKICSIQRLLKLRAEARAAGRRVVHCHGCFDVVHPGHIHHLQLAKTYGDVLI